MEPIYFEWAALAVCIAIVICLIGLGTKRTRKALQKSQSDIQDALEKISQRISMDMGQQRTESQYAFRQTREELQARFHAWESRLEQQMKEQYGTQRVQMESESMRLAAWGQAMEEKLQRLSLQMEKSSREHRQETVETLRFFENGMLESLRRNGSDQHSKLNELLSHQERLRKETEGKLTDIKNSSEGQLQKLREENARKLEEMRNTVEEKLQATVEKRFNESFRLISDRLEQVHRGLGEMQQLASGVGDLKKILGNVKTRGNWGEIQLQTILEQILSPEQYQKNALVNDLGQERIEFVIKLPGSQAEKPLLLPVDSKFPIEDYQRLIEGYDKLSSTEPKEIDALSKQFELSVRKNAKDISSKYINPPTTTDFAVMFVPTEGLYAEILRRPGLFEELQRQYKITVVGPTNLVAFLSSLQMGFKTLAIEKRSGEVWDLLGSVKTEFGAFGSVLEKTKKKLLEATQTIDKAGIRSRAIERKLREVQQLPSLDWEEATEADGLPLPDSEE